MTRKQQIILIVDSERQCSQCHDSGLIAYPNERGGMISERCPYCLSAERRFSKETQLEPRLPPLVPGGAA